MQFVESLPVGLENVPWQIAAPPGGIEESLNAVVGGQEPYLDLAIERDHKFQALIRVVPDLILGVNPDWSRERVFEIDGAKAFFLDLDGRMTENIVHLRVVITTETTQPGLSAGFVVMWPEESGFIATAS